MALDSTALSQAIFNRLVADSRAGFSDPLSPAQQDMIRAWCDAIAQEVVAEVQPELDDSTGGGGITVHNDLTGRTEPDCHPIEAIGGLTAALAAKAEAAHGHDISDVAGLQSTLDAMADDAGLLAALLNGHLARTDNPHSVTAGQIGAVPTSRTIALGHGLGGGGPLGSDISIELRLKGSSLVVDQDGLSVNVGTGSGQVAAGDHSHAELPVGRGIYRWDSGSDAWVRRSGSGVLPSSGTPRGVGACELVLASAPVADVQNLMAIATVAGVDAAVCRARAVVEAPDRVVVFVLDEASGEPTDAPFQLALFVV